MSDEIIPSIGGLFFIPCNNFYIGILLYVMAGRPTKYNQEYDKQAYKLCLLGATDKKLADFFEVDEATINRWKEAHETFRESIKNGKVVADAKVAEALFNRATGYSHPEDKIFNADGEALIVPTIKHYPPDTGAAFIWLKNRAGWKDKQEVDANITRVEILDDIAK